MARTKRIARKNNAIKVAAAAASSEQASFCASLRIADLQPTLPLFEGEWCSVIQPKSESGKIQKIEPNGTILDRQHCRYEFCVRNKDGFPFRVTLFVETVHKAEMLLSRRVIFGMHPPIIMLPVISIRDKQTFQEGSMISSFQETKLKVLRLAEETIKKQLANVSMRHEAEEFWKKKGIEDFLELYDERIQV